MSKFSTFHSKETVKARKVTDKEGEDIVTSSGPVHLNKGDYVIQHEDGVTTEEGESFENRFKAPAAKRAASKRRSTPRKRAEAPRKAAEPTPAPSAADRVRAAHSASSDS